VRRHAGRSVVVVAAILVAAALSAAGAGFTVGDASAVATAMKAGRFVVSRFPLHAGPVAVATAGGSVWVVVETRRRGTELWKLDRNSGKRLARFTIGRSGPDFGAIAVGEGVVWAAAGDHLIGVDMSGLCTVRRTSVPGQAATVTSGFGSVWVATIGQQRNLISRLNSATLAVQSRIRIADQPIALHAGMGSVWLATNTSLSSIKPANDRIVPAAVLPEEPQGLAFSAAHLWLLQRLELVTKIDRGGRGGAQVRLPFSPGSAAVSAARIWVTDNCACMKGTLALIDLQTRRLVGEQRIGETPVGVAADPVEAWVITFGDATLTRVRLSK